MPRKSLLFLLCITFGGCVYLRFLELRHQFANFGSYFQIEEKGGIALVFLKPVLLSEDIAWLMGGKPIYEKETEGETVWKYVFKKQPPNLDKEDFDIPVFLFLKTTGLLGFLFQRGFLSIFLNRYLPECLDPLEVQRLASYHGKSHQGLK